MKTFTRFNKSILKVGAVFLATLLLAAGAVAKGPNRPPVHGVPFTGYSALCEYLDMGTYVEEDGIAKLRDAVMLERIATDSPLMTGWYTQEMNFDMHLKSGRGTSWGTGELEPDTYTGTFTEEFAIKARHFEWDIQGTFIGNGDVEGILVDYVAIPIDPTLVPADFCGEGPVMGAYLFEGYIFDVE